MENASKALLIAGAILLVIAIIAIGMTILGQGTSVVNKTSGQFSAMEIKAHNDQFGELYDEKVISGSVLRDLATKAASNNSQNSGSKVCNVTITLQDSTGTAITIGKIKSGADYEISDVTYAEEGDTDGAPAGALKSFTAKEK